MFKASTLKQAGIVATVGTVNVVLQRAQRASVEKLRGNVLDVIKANIDGSKSNLSKKIGDDLFQVGVRSGNSYLKDWIEQEDGSMGSFMKCKEADVKGTLGQFAAAVEAGELDEQIAAVQAASVKAKAAARK